MKIKITKAQRKVLEDLRKQADEQGNNRKDERLLWKVRGYVQETEYWIIAFKFPITLIILIITEDFWKALGFWFLAEIYCFSGNFRGLSLHIENLIEWIIKKNV